MYNAEAMHFHSLCENSIITGNTIMGNIEDVVNDSRSEKDFNNEFSMNFGIIMKGLIEMQMDMAITRTACINMQINYGRTTPRSNFSMVRPCSRYSIFYQS